MRTYLQFLLPVHSTQREQRTSYMYSWSVTRCLLRDGIRYVVGLCVLSWIALGSKTASAFDTNYQDFIIGQRATGMGGAFTAIANDPSAAFYNPAGYAGIDRLKVAANLTLYGFEYREVQQGLARDAGGVSLKRLEFVIFPSTTGVASRFGGKDSKGRPLWGGGISFFVPFRTQMRFRTGLTETINRRQRNAMLTLHRDGQVFLAGPSIARRFGPVSIGISALYMHRFFSWILSNNVSLATCQPTDLTKCKNTEAIGSISSMEGWVGGLNFRLGILYEINKRWNVGAMLSFSTIRLWGDGSFQTHRFAVSTDPKDPNTSTPFQQKTNLLTQSPMPFEMRLGTAFRPIPSVLLTLDVVLHLGSRYKLLQDANILEVFQYPRVVQRKFMTNIHLGGEWNITPRTPFRFGLFTNLSNAPDIPNLSPTVYLSQVNMFGVTTSIGFKTGNTTLDIGVSVSYGRGQAQRLRPENAFVYERVTQENVFIFFYLSGATEFLGMGVQKLLNEAGKMPGIRDVIRSPMLSRTPSGNKKHTQTQKSPPHPKK